jgi:glyoxylase-like metal-dependent hydrolase (beta-lactamase superfamily II)
MEVAPGIHRIVAPLGDRFVCLYLLVGDDACALIDTGIDEHIGGVLVPYMERAGIALDRLGFVVITHADLDHMGGNAAVKERAPGALLLCHTLDRAMIEDVEAMIERRYGEFTADHGISDSPETTAWIREVARGAPVDLALSGGEEVRLGPTWRVQILHTPGHSRGHLTVYDPRSKAAIIADTTLWNAVLTAEGAPAFPPTYRYVETYIASNERLQGMAIDLLLTSHYPIYRGLGVAEFLGESRAFVDRVDEALRDELRQATKPLALRELMSTLSPRLGRWPEAATPSLAYPLLGHLERLQQYGEVAAERRDGRLQYRWRG